MMRTAHSDAIAVMRDETLLGIVTTTDLLAGWLTVDRCCKLSRTSWAGSLRPWRPKR